MRARPFLFLFPTATLLAAPSLRAQGDCATPGEDWVVESFDAEYAVRPGGSIDVTERIAVDFGALRKHGIYRDVHRRFRRPAAAFRERLEGTPGSGAWEEASFDLDVESVVDETGASYEVETSRQGDVVRIRIGSPDFCVSGPATYVIRYVIDDGVARLPDYGEFYWQATGTEWVVPIERAAARVVLAPARVAAFADSAPWDASCYAGPQESTSGEACTARVAAPGVYEFATTEPLRPGEGLTFAATFPAGLVPGATPAERAWDLLVLLAPLALPPLALLAMLTLWWRRGKEPAAGSVVPEWDPPEGLKPGAAGALRDQRADMDDIVATILDLAVHGVIKIREVPPELLPGVDEDSFLGKALDKLGVRDRDWELVHLERGAFGLVPYERQLLVALFDGRDTRRLSDLEEKFYKEIPKIRDGLYGDLVKRKLFPRSPQATRRLWLVIGIAIAALAVPLGILGFAVDSPLILPALVVAGLIVVGFSFFMPAMTPLGARVRRHVEGLEEYIRRAEKAEIEFRNAPERTPELFDRLLPYAIALDVSDVWAHQFEGVLTHPPAWYEGRPGTGWTPNLLVHDLSSFRSSASSTLASSPGGSGGGGSFGGGSVGGGGGGGGGGSW
jgi:uncharacterized membrane protein YgcG